MEKNKPHFRLPKSVRICRKTDFDLLYAPQATRFFSYPITCQVLLRTQKGDEANLKYVPRVPKKKWKRAVDRNAAKRRLKESLRLVLPELSMQVPPNCTLLLVLGFANEKIPSHHETFKAISRLLNRAILPYLATTSLSETSDSHDI